MSLDIAVFTAELYRGVAVSPELAAKHAALVAQVLYDLPDSLLLTEADTPRTVRHKIEDLSALVAGQQRWIHRSNGRGRGVSIAFGNKEVWRRSEFGAVRRLRVMLGWEAPSYSDAEWRNECAAAYARDPRMMLVIHRETAGPFFPASVRRILLDPACPHYGRIMRIIECWAKGVEA
jgi:hypothetical protein